jgi:HlyD family secretion protein
MKLPVIIVGLTLAGAGTTAYVTDSFGGDEVGEGIPEEGLFTVRRGTLNVTITENGTLVAKESRKVDSDMKGQAKITFLVEEGSEVEEGDVLCKLDTTEQEEQLEQRGLDMVKAEADLDTARTELDIQKTDNQASIEKAEIAKDKALKERERYVEGDAPKDRRNIEVKIKTARTNFTRAKKRFEDSKLLRAKDYINKSQLLEDEINFEQATVELQTAERDLELFDIYTLPMTLTEKDVAVRDGERGVETSAMRAKSTLRQREVAVDQYEKRLQKLKDQADDLTEEIEKMTLTAPGPGIVIYGDPRRPWNRDRIRVGGEIWGQTTVITLPDLRVMQVKLRVHEADINKLAVDLTAKVSMDSYPGVVLDGKVTKIASIASGDNPWDSDPEVKKFDVEITMESVNSELDLKPGISAKAETFIERRVDVLYVPIQCVFLENGKHWVYLAEAGAPRAVEVEPGLNNDSYIEIRSGLSVGDEVLIYNPNIGEKRSGEDESDGLEDPEEELTGDADDADESGEEVDTATDADADTGADIVIDPEADEEAVPVLVPDGEGDVPVPVIVTDPSTVEASD